VAWDPWFCRWIPERFALGAVLCVVDMVEFFVFYFNARKSMNPRAEKLVMALVDITFTRNLWPITAHIFSIVHLLATDCFVLLARVEVFWTKKRPIGE